MINPTIRYLYQIIVLAICPLPFYDAYVEQNYHHWYEDISEETVYVHLSDWLFAFMFIRILFLVKTLLSLSMYRDEHA